MFKRHLTKPDGRSLWLYARQPIPDGLAAPSPSAQPVAANSHLRWHPLRGEWIAYASHRQHRTFLPPPEWNPLAVTTEAAAPTEVPSGPWEVAVFENLFPTLTGLAHDPPESIVDDYIRDIADLVRMAPIDDQARFWRSIIEKIEAASGL